MDLVDGTGLIIEQPSETESELGLLPCVKTLPLRLSPTSGSISLPSALLLIRGSNDLRTHLCEDVGNMSIRQGVSSAEDCFDITIGGRGAGAFGRSWEITVRGRLMDRFRCLACDLGEFPLLIDERFPPRATPPRRHSQMGRPPVVSPQALAWRLASSRPKGLRLRPVPSQCAWPQALVPSSVGVQPRTSDSGPLAESPSVSAWQRAPDAWMPRCSGMG